MLLLSTDTCYESGYRSIRNHHPTITCKHRKITVHQSCVGELRQCTKKCSETHRDKSKSGYQEPRGSHVIIVPLGALAKTVLRDSGGAENEKSEH